MIRTLRLNLLTIKIVKKKLAKQKTHVNISDISKEKNFQKTRHQFFRY
jgi:hypothetical protein